MDQPSAQSRQLGVIYTIGPSYRDINRIWVGTDDGLVQTTADGRKRVGPLERAQDD